MKLVTVFNSFTPVEADLAWSRLNAAEFHATILHEISSLSTDGYAMATGGIKVQVPEDEAQDARELLNSTDSTPGNE